jgi:hypothetical protein
MLGGVFFCIIALHTVSEWILTKIHSICTGMEEMTRIRLVKFVILGFESYRQICIWVKLRMKRHHAPSRTCICFEKFGKFGKHRIRVTYQDVFIRIQIRLLKSFGPNPYTVMNLIPTFTTRHFYSDLNWKVGNGTQSTKHNKACQRYNKRRLKY